MESAQSAPPPLHGLRILELSQTPAAAYAGRLLAGMGGQVILIEPPGGSPIRRRGPFPDDQPRRDCGASHLHLQRGKQSLRLNLATAAARRILSQLLSDADAVLTDIPIADWDAIGFDPERLRSHHSQLQICTITPYGANGPKADWQANELTAYAAGGYLRITGEPDREPVKAWGDQAHHQAGVHAALGLLAALHAQRDGIAAGQHIDVAVVEAVAFLLGGGYQHAWFRDHEPMRNGARLVGFGPGHLYPSTIRPCADGFVHAHCNNRYPDQMAVLFDQPRLADPELLATLMGHADEVDDLMAPMLESTPRREVVRRAQELRIPFTEVLRPSEVIADLDGHHASRDFWQQIGVDSADNDPLLAPGPAVLFGRTPWRDGPAPKLNQYADTLGDHRERARWRRANVA